MFIAHLPAGYLGVRVLGLKRRAVQVALLSGSIFPDLDMLYFYLIDGRQTLHHLYWTHLPIFWLTIAGALAFCLFFQKMRSWIIVSLAFVGGCGLHILLDGFVGGISWLYPFGDTHFYLIKIPARHDWWVMNFVLHWTFLLEVVLCAWAFYFLTIKKSSKK